MSLCNRQLTLNRELVKNKVKQRKHEFERLERELNNVEDLVQKTRQSIVHLSFLELIDALQIGDYSAKQVVDAYRWKAMQVQKELNCVTEFIVEAPKLAEQLDEKYVNGNKKPPLFGVPFSVKDNLFLVGYSSSSGTAKQSEVIMQIECSFVSHLKFLGAIPIVRTNIPQTLMFFVCTNPLFGTTCNPFDKSSIPITNSTCWTTFTARFIVTGAQAGIPGCRLAMGYGYFTHTTAEQEILLKLTMNESYFQRVPQTAPLQWGEVFNGLSEILKIGYFYEDGFIKPVPSSIRAVLETKEKMEKLGHQLIPFTVPNPFLAASLMFRAAFPDGGSFIKSEMVNEDVDPLLTPMFTTFNLPLFMKRFISFATKRFWPEVSLLSGAVVRSLDHLRETNDDINDYIIQFTNYWQELELDALICPGFLVPPLTHDTPAKLSAAAFSTGLFNLVDYPAGVLPVTKVNEEDEKALFCEYPSHDAAQLSKKRYMIKYPIHHVIRQGSKGATGLPVGKGRRTPLAILVATRVASNSSRRPHCQDSSLTRLELDATRVATKIARDVRRP